MVREIFARIAPSVKYVCTTDEKEAIGKADFIITTIRAGKEESRIIDERVALKYGVIGQETTGVGGFAMALRSIPTLLHYTDVIEVSCYISKKGAAPKSGPYTLPESAKQLICTVKYYERMAAQAIVEQNTGKAIEALMVHPLVNSYSLAEELLKEYLEIYRDYTGGWKI